MSLLLERLRRNAAEAARRALRDGLKPDPDLLVSEWADGRIFISKKFSSGGGPFRIAKTPYLREPLDCLSPSMPQEMVTLEFARQLGKTQAGLCWWGYTVNNRPSSFLYSHSTLDQAKRYSKQKVDPTVEESPCLRGKITDRSNKDQASSTLIKEYPGGLLLLIGSNSKDALASVSAGYLHMDEVDRYPVDVEGEGDPIGILVNAANNFFRRKILITSTPTITERSNVENYYNLGDRSQFQIPCPLCGGLQVLVLTGEDCGLVWEKDDPATARYRCVHCHALFDEYHKEKFLAAGRWIARNPDRSSLHRSFQLSTLYAPLGWLSWPSIVKRFLDTKKKPATLRAFVNTVLGETYRERGDQPDWEPLLQRREAYRFGTLPKGVLLLTGAVDVQKDRLEIYVYGWGRRGQCWLIDRAFIMGDPVDRKVWRELDSYVISRTYSSEWLKADLPIRRSAVDAGYQSSEVYRYVRRHVADKVIATLGKHNLPVPIGAPKPVDITTAGKKIYRGAKFFPVGTDYLKGELYSFLRLQPPTEGEEYPEGFLHFPADADEDYFKQLTAEHQVLSHTKSRESRYAWEKVRDRNEALDCYVYARAVAVGLGVDRWTDEGWTALEEELRGSGLAGRKPADKTRRRPHEGYLD